MDFNAVFLSEIQSARLELIIKVGNKMAYDWLLSKDVGPMDAFSKAKRGPTGQYSSLPRREFSPEEIAEYEGLWDKAAELVSEYQLVGHHG